MNVFEALEKGKGKAELFYTKGQYAQQRPNGRIYWITPEPFVDIVVDGKDLMRNDWIPYVPRETPKLILTSPNMKPYKVNDPCETKNKLTPYEAYFWCRLKLKEMGFNQETIDNLLTKPDVSLFEYKSDVPRETEKVKDGNLQSKLWKIYYSLCSQLAEAGYTPDVIRKILVRPGFGVVQGDKTKRREVFKEIEISKLLDPWASSSLRSQRIVYYPLFLDMESYEKFKSLYRKSHMTMIIEWEE